MTPGINGTKDGPNMTTADIFTPMVQSSFNVMTDTSSQGMNNSSKRAMALS